MFPRVEFQPKLGYGRQYFSGIVWSVGRPNDMQVAQDAIQNDSEFT
jgi:hypothetical protein